MENLILTRVYGAPGHELGEIEAWLEKYGAPLRPYIRDTGRFLSGASAAGKGILFEAQLGALRDLEQASAPTPPRPTPWQPTPSWAAGLSRGAWTRSWA